MQKNSFSILIIFAALSMVGLAVIPSLRLQLNPSQSLPVVQVIYSWQNASPEILEQEVTTPLEGVFSTLNELSSIESKTSNNNGSITLAFNKKSDLEKIRFEIASLIRQTYPKLPYGVTYPLIIMNSSEDEEIKSPLISYMFNGPTDLVYLKTYALNNIKNKFFDIKGISEIRVSGGTETAYEIVYDQNQLNTLELQKTDIENSIRNYFQSTSIGLAFTGSDEQRQINVRLSYQGSEAHSWNEIMISNKFGRMIRLIDICKIEKVELPPNSYYRVNGLNTINILFYPEKGVNHLILAKSIKDRIAELSLQIPQKHDILLSYDSTLFISKELNKILSRTIITIVILLLFIIIITLSIRYLFIILISLIVNICLSFTIYALLGIDIHIYSLAGITISLGLIIDNSIVMIDHIRSFQNKKVFLALLASTLTTITSLIIVLFLPDDLRLRLIDFAFIIIINLSVSLIIALWFIPALLEKIPLWKSKTRFRSRKRLIVKISRVYRKIILLFVRWKVILMIMAVLGFGLPVFMLPAQLEGESESSWRKIL